MNNGYLVVASRKESFYRLAINCLESLKDYYPDAKCCLVTEERFLDGRESIADDIIFCGNHYREKLWGMSQSPYDTTMYIDADCEVVHKDIATVFDELNGNDMIFHTLPIKAKPLYAIYDFTCDDKPENFTYCGGVCLYTNKEFMEDWYDLYLKQVNRTWKPNIQPWDKLYKFDQTTLWWLLNKEPKYNNIKVGNFADNLRWNYYHGYEQLKLFPKQEVIIKHYSHAAPK